MLNKLLNPRNDVCFKKIFGSEANKDILIQFLNDIFDRAQNPIQTVTFLSTAHEPAIAAQRMSIVDVLCQDTIGNKFIVEMQTADEIGFEKRAQYYAAKTYIEQRTLNVDYRDLKSVTFLAITGFTLFPEKPDYLCHHALLDLKTLERDLEDFSFSFLELSKFKKQSHELSTMVERWAYFLKYADAIDADELLVAIGSNRIIQKAYHVLNSFGWTEAELRAYDSADMRRSSDRAVLAKALSKAELKGMLKGTLKGEQKKQIEIARQLFKLGVDRQLIQSGTGLSENELNEALKSC